MSSKKTYYIMLGILGLLSLLIIGSVVMGDMLLKKQSAKLVSLKLDNQVIDEQLKSVVQAKKDIEKYSELSAIARQIVPQDKDQARAVREIVQLAQESGIQLASLTFPTSNLGATKAVTPAAGSSSSASSTPATTPATTTPTPSQVKAVEGAKGVYQLDINAVSESKTPVTFGQLTTFLQKLEHNRRTAQVTQIAIQTAPNVGARNISFTLTITVYIKP